MYTLPQPFGLRPAASADQAFLEALYFSSREDLHHALPDAAALGQLIAMQRRMQEAGFERNFPDARHLVLERAGQPIGRVVVDEGPGDLRLVDIAVAPAARRCGAAAAVVRALQAAAARRGVPVTLAVAKANAAALGLYRSLGFEVRGEDPVVEQMAWHPGGAGA